ncbi:hypothetical protein L3Y34_018895 [Caenorhabditis briggsae]|uniref:NTF2-like domain-containing protein n=1 Tax=Caenorhabditis briggsae TaxID=6238 RepID=A0AAE9DPE9_CAEBR|nr:hypothetical protein L3Y34_018895 [Caenorhabditis briggsae]
MLKLLFWFLVIFAPITVFAKNKTHKLNSILKEVGRRYVVQDINEKVLDDLAVSDSNHNWELEPDEFVKEFKNKWVESLTQNIRYSSSILNLYWGDRAKNIMNVELDDMVANICDSEVKFNKVQFDRYIYKQRKYYEEVTESTPYSSEVFATGKSTIHMIFRIELTHRMGYKTTITWNIIARISTWVSVNGYDRNFKIANVTIGGGCTEFGVLNLNHTDLLDRENALQKLKKETNPEVKALFDLFTPSYMKYYEDFENKIPKVWMQGFEKSPRNLRITVCDQREVHQSPRYSETQFRSWYKRFGQMWHPKKGDKDYIKVQVLEANDAGITARVTMRLQPGANETALTYDFDFKMGIQFNVGCTNRWTVTWLDVLCQPHIDFMEENYLSMRGLFMKELISTYEEEDNWYTALNVLKKFEKDPITTSVCFLPTDVREAKNVDDTLKLFFDIAKKYHNSTVWGVFTNDELILPAEEKHTFSVRFALGHPSTEDKPTEPIVGTRWEFQIQWDKNDQFYYIYHIVIGCVDRIKSDGTFMQIRRRINLGLQVIG